MKKLMLLAAGAVGYVLGARAGRERYEQIKGMATKVKDDPRVQDARPPGGRHRQGAGAGRQGQGDRRRRHRRREGQAVGQQRRRPRGAAQPRQRGAAGQPLPPGRPALTRRAVEDLASVAAGSCAMPLTACASVSDATWSTTTRRRAASSAAAAQSSANGGSSASGPALPQRLEQLGEQLALTLHQRHPVLACMT